MPSDSDEIPVAMAVDEARPRTPAESRYARAAKLLDRAGGSSDAEVLRLLAQAHRQQGNWAEARAALRRITTPDADTLLQMALLSLQEQQLAQAEGELARAWQLDPESYEIAYNLLFTRLSLGQIAGAAEMAPRVAVLTTGRANGASERRFFTMLAALLRHAEVDGDPRFDPVFAEWTDADEKRLLSTVRDLGHLDTSVALCKILVNARPSSASAREAYFEVVLIKAKELADRCAWTEAEVLLRQIAKDTVGNRGYRVALLNLLGCSACMTQDFDNGLRYFGDALKLAPNEVRLHQNMALGYELAGQPARAEPHWQRFLDLLDDRVPGPLDSPRYVENLLYHSLRRLADRAREKELLDKAIGYLQRAHRARPNDAELLEHLFQTCNQAKQPEEARKALDRLRELKPEDAQLELYELDLIDLDGLAGIEKLITGLERALQRFPGNPTVDERAALMVGNLLPILGTVSDRMTDQLTKVIEQVRHLPNYQINWSAVRDVMKDLLKDFQKLRRLTAKCLTLVKHEDQRRVVRSLLDHLDKKMEACKSMMG